MSGFVAGWLLAGLFAVGVSSSGQLELGPVNSKQAAADWNALHVGAQVPGAEADPLPPALLGELRFELTSLAVPRLSAFAPILESYLRREMDRGWLVRGRFGKAGADGARSATFSRVHPGLKLDWSIPGVARPVPCAAMHAGADTLGCFLVTPERKDGAATIELGYTRLRVFPRIMVTLRKQGEGTAADAQVLAVLLQEDAEKLWVKPGELGDPMQVTLLTILKNLMVPPQVDGNHDGRPDAWRFEAQAGFRVSVSPGSPSGKAPAPDPVAAPAP